MNNCTLSTKRNRTSLTLHITVIPFLLLFLFCATMLQAQKETRETVQHPTLGEVTLVKTYKDRTNEVEYVTYEQQTTIVDPTFGEMDVVNEYDTDGVLEWQTRFKNNYNDPKLGIVNVEQEYVDNELDSDYRIKKNHKDPALGSIDIILEFYEGELYETYKVKTTIEEDATLGKVETTIIYDENNDKSSETITYGATTINKSYYKNKLTSEIKNYVDEHNNSMQQELKYTGDNILEQAYYSKNGKRDGVQKYFYSDGIPKAEYTYKNGMKVGLQKSYHSNGQLSKQETINENDKLEGTYVIYKYDGTIKTKGEYLDGKKIGTWEEYGSRNPNLLKKCVYSTVDCAVCEELDYNDHGSYFTINSITSYSLTKDDYVKNGSFTSYHNYKKGLINEQGAYKDGYRFGPWRMCDEKGNIICKVTYLDANRVTDQEYTSYYDDGTIHFKGSNLNYYPCGGKTTFTGEGYENRYDDDGTISSEKKYFDGVIVSENMYERGALLYERAYKNGKKIGVTAYDKEKRIESKTRTVNDTTYVELYNYQSEELISKDVGYMIKGQKSPYTYDRIITYTSGELRAKGTMIVDTLKTTKNTYNRPTLNHSKTGPWKYYYKSGKVELSGSYQKDQPTGEWTAFHENGALKEKGNFKLSDDPNSYGDYTSKKVGVWIRYDKDGNVVEEKDFKDGSE